MQNLQQHTQIHPQNQRHQFSTDKNTTRATTSTESNNHVNQATDIPTDIPCKSVFMSTEDSGVSGNSEWVLFDNPLLDEGDYVNEEDGNVNVNDDDDDDGILSTLSSAFHILNYDGIRGDYVISDFSPSYIPGNAHSHISDDEDLISEQDSLIQDVRKGIETINRRQSEVVEVKKREDLILKINEWKSHSTDSQRRKDKERERSDLLNNIIRAYQIGKFGNRNSSIHLKQMHSLKKIATKMKTGLTRDDRVIEKEGVFMNNPDLETCIPGYWKRIMLDNIITEKNDVVSVVALDDIIHMKQNKIKNSNSANGKKHFWETEGSSTQSISTGWEGTWA